MSRLTRSFHGRDHEPLRPRSPLTAALESYKLATDAVLMIAALIPDRPVRGDTPLVYPQQLLGIVAELGRVDAPNAQTISQIVESGLRLDPTTRQYRMLPANRLAIMARRLYVQWDEANDTLTAHPESDEYLLAAEYAAQVIVPHREKWARVVSLMNRRMQG